MPLPSYARATASSRRKTGLASSKVKVKESGDEDGKGDKTEITSLFASAKERRMSQSSGGVERSNTASKGHGCCTPPTQLAHLPAGKHPARKLKRPSTLTPKARRKQAYNADLHPITPANPAKPSPLSNLPSELRTEIYSHVFAARDLRDPCLCRFDRKAPSHREQCAGYLFPALLHVCRAMRIEAAYTFYTSVPFTWRVMNLNFSRVRRWLEVLPATHRGLLARNRGLVVDVMPFVEKLYTYPPEKYLLDDYIDRHWKACSPFGYLYNVPTAQRLRFIIFCRLAAWFLQPFCNPLESATSSSSFSLRWIYRFDNYRRRDYDAYPTLADGLVAFLKEDVSVVRMRAVQKAWTANRREAEMRIEASRFLDALDACFKQVVGTEKRQKVTVGDWEEGIKALREFIAKW